MLATAPRPFLCTVGFDQLEPIINAPALNVTQHNRQIQLPGLKCEIQRLLNISILSVQLRNTLNETYNRSSYILAAGSGNKTWWSKEVSCIHKEAPCPDSSSYFISVGRLFIAHARS